MPDLNVDVDYFDHPKTKRLVGLLGRGAEVLPLKLWSYCGKFHAEDGRLAGYSPQEIESIVSWWGKPGALIPALVKVGFVDETEQGLEVHEWKTHQGHICAFKIRGSKANAARWKKWKSLKVSNKDASRSLKQEDKESPIPTKPTIPTNEEDTTPAREVPTEEMAVTMAMNAGVEQGFVRYVYRTWVNQNGKNANGILVDFLPWLVNRWKNEQVEWNAGTHKGNRQQKAGGGGAFKNEIKQTIHVKSL